MSLEADGLVYDMSVETENTKYPILKSLHLLSLITIVVQTLQLTKLFSMVLLFQTLVNGPIIEMGILFYLL